MKLKSLLITYDFPPLITGIGTFFYSTWKLLDPSRHSILAPRIQGYRQYDGKNSFSIFRYAPFSRCRSLRVLLLYCKVASMIIREKVNVLVCAVPLSIGVIGLTFKKILGIPYCIFYYGGEYDKYKKRTVLYKLLKSILENADCIITNSAFSSKDAARFALRHERIITVTPGVDTERFRPDIDCSQLRQRHHLEGKKVLLTVSRLVKRKGIDIVLEAVAGIINEIPEVVYIVVGSGEEEGFFKEMAKKLGIDSHVIFTGSVSDSDLPRYYSLCDMYVMPNRITEGEEVVEGFGISFIEAQSAAKPVIGGLSGGANDAVADGITGFLIDSNDAQALSKKITRLLMDKEYAKSIGLRARERMLNEFTWKVRAEKLDEIFRSLVKK